MENSQNFSPDLLDQSSAGNTAEIPYNPLKDNVFILGLVLLLVSLLMFGIKTQTEDNSGFFLLHFALVWVYTITLWVNKRLRWWLFGSHRADFPGTMVLLMLWLVSCFALNQEMEVFRPSTLWLSGYLCVAGLASVAYAWKDRMSAGARLGLWFLLSASLVLFLYYALALLPISMYGLIVVWFFALPLHAFVPLVICVYLSLILMQAAQADRWGRAAIISGIALPLLVVIIFSNAWYQVSSRMATSAQTSDNQSLSELPRWVNVSQKLEKNWLNGYLLKAVAEGNFPQNRGMMGDFLQPTFGAKENDPLMQIAAAISPKPELNELECRKIYAAQYDARMVMEDRLWSGDDLATTLVKTKVMLDPGHRLSYTEKVLTVALIPKPGSRNVQTQEAIYTFFLPGGGTVSSLSLWINGVEEPGVLTTRAKASEAYTTIVGRERRDPAVVFWQEGNQVRVRVFPVTVEMPRTFKIGVTAPLRLENQGLVYDNVSFDGPSALLAKEQDSVYLEGNASFAEVPGLFKKEAGAHALSFDGPYRHRWSLTCNAPELSRSVFSFDGKTYLVQPWLLQPEPYTPSFVYLDVNAAWTANEWKKIREMNQNQRLMVAVDGKFELLIEENADHVFQQSREWRFSLFPFHKISNPENALVITKSGAVTPLPSELEGSVFGDSLKKMDGRASIRVYHLGTELELTAYLRALRESRDIFCISGDMERLNRYLQTQTFAQNPENAQQVALPEAGMLISEKADMISDKAPDHLFRLFAYNSVLRDLHGRSNEAPEALIRLAEQANVVTPISSLITLESKEDYERFDIQKTPGLKALGNAGAVPEPHEWALIILLVFSAGLAWRRVG